MKHQKQLRFLYQEANTKNFEKTCLPCLLYHLLNITGKIQQPPFQRILPKKEATENTLSPVPFFD